MLKRMADCEKAQDCRRRSRRGLMIAGNCERPEDAGIRAAERDRIVELAFERGVLFLGCGPSTVRIAPPPLSPRTRRRPPSTRWKSRLQWWKKGA